MFTLAIDARDLARDHRGLGRYARALVSRFAAHPDVQLVLLVKSLLPARYRTEFEKALDSTHFRIASAIPRSADITWHPWNGIFFEGNGPHAVTIADAAPFRFPQSDPAKRNHQQRPFLHAVKTAASIITISHSSARDLVAFLHAEPAKISVTHLGVDDRFAPGKPAALPKDLRTGGYFLFIGEPDETRKNFSTLLAAHRQAYPEGGPPLAVLSLRDPQEAGTVHVPLSDEQTLRALYQGAVATCVPSTYEGFGMPVLESMACGTPVLCARASSLPEVAGDAAELIDPADSNAWARSLRAVAADAGAREGLRVAGLARAAEFSWQQCAEQTLSVLRETAHRVHYARP